MILSDFGLSVISNPFSQNIKSRPKLGGSSVVFAPDQLRRYSDSGLFGVYGVGQAEKAINGREEWWVLVGRWCSWFYF